MIKKSILSIHVDLRLNATTDGDDCCYNESHCYPDVECTEDDVVSLPTKISVGTLLLLVCLASVVNNVLTLYVFARYRKPFTPTTACVVSLAASDLIMTLTIGPADFSLFVMDLHWVLGRSYCKVSAYFQMCAVFASCATLCCIAVERHYSVVHPLFPRLKPLHVGVAVGGVWAIAFGISVPALFMYDYVVVEYEDEELSADTFCYASKKLPMDDRRKYLLSIFLMAFLPVLFLITCLYAHLAHFLWIRKSVGNVSQIGAIPQVRRKKKIVKTLVVLTVMYIGCRVPIHIYSMVREFVAMKTTPVQQVIRLLLITLNLANAAANPLLYSLFHQHLRRLLVLPCKRICHAINPKGRVIGVWTSFGNGLDSKTLQSPEMRRVQFRLTPRLHEGSGSSGTTTTLNRT